VHASSRGSGGQPFEEALSLSRCVPFRLFSTTSRPPRLPDLVPVIARPTRRTATTVRNSNDRRTCRERRDTHSARDHNDKSPDFVSLCGYSIHIPTSSPLKALIYAQSSCSLVIRADTTMDLSLFGPYCMYIIPLLNCQILRSSRTFASALTYSA